MRVVKEKKGVQSIGLLVMVLMLLSTLPLIHSLSTKTETSCCSSSEQNHISSECKANTNFKALSQNQTGECWCGCCETPIETNYSLTTSVQVRLRTDNPATHTYLQFWASFLRGNSNDEATYAKITQQPSDLLPSFTTHHWCFIRLIC